jgi:hypothetical protein
MFLVLAALACSWRRDARGVRAIARVGVCGSTAISVAASSAARSRGSSRSSCYRAQFIRKLSMKRLTDALKEVRGCRDVRVLGHVMVAGNRVVSMDERGLIR